MILYTVLGTEAQIDKLRVALSGGMIELPVFLESKVVLLNADRAIRIGQEIGEKMHVAVLEEAKEKLR